MKYNIPKLLEDFYIDNKGENSRGWIHLEACPYCGSKNGAVRYDSPIFYCWKCDGHPWHEFIFLISGRKWREIEHFYKADPNVRDLYLQRKTEAPRPKVVELPRGTGKLNERAKKYLSERKFNPEELEKIYNLQSTGHLGMFNFRIVIPICFEGRIVSYTCRSYAKGEPRYMSCKNEDEIICHKDILFGYDLVENDSVIVVEGPFDAMRFKGRAVALFGTGYKQSQVNLLGTFRRVFILFDPEEEAQEKAKNLGESLSGLGVEVENIFIKGLKDPGDMEQKDADSLVKELLGEWNECTKSV